jgi:hypothetical protein
MYLFREYETEYAMRDANVRGFNSALRKYPPIYATDFADEQLIHFNVSKVLMEQSIVLILAEDDVTHTWRSLSTLCSFSITP